MRTEFKLTNNIARLKRGSYIISDPCYVMSDADYEDVIEVGNETGYDIVNYPYDEIFICGVGDDGIYMDNKGNKYGVDSGMIGAIPLDLCTDETKFAWKDYVHVEFTEDTDVGYEQLSRFLGQLTIGDFTILTGSDRFEDYDNCEALEFGDCGDCECDIE